MKKIYYENRKPQSGDIEYFECEDAKPFKNNMGIDLFIHTFIGYDDKDEPLEEIRISEGLTGAFLGKGESEKGAIEYYMKWNNKRKSEVWFKGFSEFLLKYKTHSPRYETQQEVDDYLNRIRELPK